MGKHRLRKSMKSFYGTHIDSQKEEQLKGSKAEIEDKVKKALKLIEDEDPERKDGISAEDLKTGPLVELIEDLHQNYESLYSQYDHLTGELKKRIHAEEDKESSSSSSSDSESDTSKDRGSKNGHLEGDFQRISDSFKQQVEIANAEIADLRKKLTDATSENEALSLKYHTVLSKAQEAEENIKDLTITVQKLGDEKSRFKLENEELHQRLDAASKIEAGLNQRLEGAVKEKDSLILEKETAITKFQQDEKAILQQELQAVKEEVRNLKQHVDFAQHQVSDLSLKLKVTEEENQNLSSKLSSGAENAENTIQELKAELNDWKKKMEQKERELSAITEMHELHQGKSSAQIKGLEEQMRSLELELESAQSYKRDMEVQTQKGAAQAENLTEEIRQLQARISDLEMMLKDREVRLSARTKTVQNSENESSTKISDLMTQVSSLKEELESVQALKTKMEQQFERERDTFSGSLTKIENEKMELTNQLTEQQRILKEKEDAFKKLMKGNKQTEVSLQDCKVRLHDAEKKMERMAEQLHKNSAFKDPKVPYLEDIIEDLKRSLDVKIDEVSTLVENARTVEVKLRLSNQKVRVTEQLLTEKEERIKELEAKHQLEIAILEERILHLCGVVNTHQNMIRDISEEVKGSLTGLETVIEKFVGKCEDYEKKILGISNELQIANNWAKESKTEKEQLRQSVSQLPEQLENMTHYEVMLRKQTEELETKACEEDNGEKEYLAKADNQLDKKIEDMEKTIRDMERYILDLGQEKREVIRQLSISIEYHQSRYDHLKKKMSRVAVGNQRTA